MAKEAMAITATYYGSAKFKASRARTAKRRYWRDPEKARQRLRNYRARKRHLSMSRLESMARQ